MAAGGHIRMRYCDVDRHAAPGVNSKLTWPGRVVGMGNECLHPPQLDVSSGRAGLEIEGDHEVLCRVKLRTCRWLQGKEARSSRGDLPSK